MSTVISKIYLSSERREKLLDLTDAHSIPYQNEIQYFSLRHEEKPTLALPFPLPTGRIPLPRRRREDETVAGLDNKF